MGAFHPDQSDDQQASMEAMQKASANILKLIRAGFTIDLRD